MWKWTILTLSVLVVLLIWCCQGEKSDNTIVEARKAQSSDSNSFVTKPTNKQEPVIQSPPPPIIEKNLQLLVGASLYPEGLKPLHQTTTVDGNYELAFLGPKDFGPTHIDGQPYTNNGRIVPATIEIVGSIIDVSNERHMFVMDIGPELTGRNNQVTLWLKDTKTRQTQTDIALFLGSLEVGMGYEVEIFANPLSMGGIRSSGEVNLFRENDIYKQIGTGEGGQPTSLRR